MVLRDPRPDDAETLAQAFLDDPQLGATVGFERDPDLEWWRDALGDEDGYRARGEGMNLVITDASDVPLGATGLLRLDARHRRAEVSIWLAPGARAAGRGLTALELLRDWAIPALGLVRLQLTTATDNAAMLACAQRAGFVREGVLRAYTFERGRPVDNVMLAVVP